jgi:hypothetical protein
MRINQMMPVMILTITDVLWVCHLNRQAPS